ncbi:MAG: hypothetical protein LUI04_06005 [Porphyromonadaceae bacterium]|nr:hypothetical protein [Porphyromonadaceae bacterium]
MGGRGALQGNRVPEEKRSYRNESPKGVKEIEGVKILRSLETPLAKVPIVSNTPDTRYIVANREGEIHYISEYRNNKLVFSVDIDYQNGIHGHVWDKNIERTSHDKTNIYRVPERYMGLLRGCLEYNHKYFGKPKEGKMSGNRDVDIEALLKKRKQTN